MRNINHHAKKAICSIYAAVLLWALAVHGAVLPPDLVRAEPNDANSLLEAAQRRLRPDIVPQPTDVKSLMEAVQRRAESNIAPLWLSSVRPAVLVPGVDNAALLYYQSFLLRPEPNDITSSRIGEVIRGDKPDKDIREYLQRCHLMIELAEAASQIRQCNWGIVYSHGLNLSSNVIWEMRQLSFVLAVYARTLAADGKYRAALDTCLTLRRLARHIGEDTYPMYATSLALETMALSCIQHILGSMPPDIDTLTWLQGQLTGQGAPRLPSVWMETARDIELQFMRTNPKRLELWRKQVKENTKHPKAKKDILSLTDEEVLLRARQSYDKFLDSVNRTIGSDTPYTEKYAEMQKLSDEFQQQPASNPVILLRSCAGPVIPCYRMYIRQLAHFNAVKVAIEIYLATVKTGLLPSTLPDGLPKDPYSGQDFEYETTKDGFVLRCRVKAIDDGKVWQYEFKVRKSDSAEAQPSK